MDIQFVKAPIFLVGFFSRDFFSGIFSRNKYAFFYWYSFRVNVEIKLVAINYVLNCIGER